MTQDDLKWSQKIQKGLRLHQNWKNLHFWQNSFLSPKFDFLPLCDHCAKYCYIPPSLKFLKIILDFKIGWEHQTQIHFTQWNEKWKKAKSFFSETPLLRKTWEGISLNFGQIKIGIRVKENRKFRAKLFFFPPLPPDGLLLGRTNRMRKFKS